MEDAKVESTDDKVKRRKFTVCGRFLYVIPMHKF